MDGKGPFGGYLPTMFHGGGTPGRGSEVGRLYSSMRHAAKTTLVINFYRPNYTLSFRVHYPKSEVEHFFLWNSNV